MGSEWPVLALQDAGVSLFDCVHKTPPDAGEGYPYIAIPQMKAGHIDFEASPRLISEESYLAWTKKAKPQPNDVVLSRRCNPGEIAHVPEGVEFALGQNLVLMRSDGEQVYPPFLRWLLQSHAWWHQVDKYINVGAIFDSLRCVEIPRFELPVPPLRDQKAIAHILGSLDDKIELNRKINQTLESMAQALFKSWFVDFDPVIDNALAAGNPIPEALQAKADTRRALQQNGQTKPLPAEIQSLFPDSFTYTEELGWVPEGWATASIADTLTVNPRVSLPKGKVATFADMKALPTTGYSVSEVGTKPYSGGAKFLQGDVLVARITPCLQNGKTALVDFLDDDEVGFGSTEFIVLRGKGSIAKAFVACLGRSEPFRNHCMASMVGSSGRQRVQNACFSDFFLALPKDDEILLGFEGLVAPFFERLTCNGRASKSLAHMRDTLLPKLISGELRIPDAEKLVAEADL